MATHGKSSREKPQMASKPPQIPPQNSSSILEPNYPRPGNFTMVKDYVPQTEPVFPPGYQPSRASCNNIDVHLKPSFGEFPVSTRCPHCRDAIITHITYRPGRITFILVGILFIIGCCLIPLCVKQCQDVIHCCPQCDGFLGVFRREFQTLK